MDALLKILRNQTFVVATGVIVLIVMVYIFGSILGIPITYRIIIMVVVVFGAIIFMMYKKMKEAQKAGQLEQDISSQAAMQMQNLSPEKRAEIEQFKKQLEAAITSLKNSKLGKGKSGKAALYALPWYMIIGPSAAGKTTAIQNSGLEFPFGKEGFRGVGGTRNCDWFFSNKAIFLDTAGRYVTQSEDRAEWFAFLNILKKNRKKRPVNGVIAALNIDEIINSGTEQLYEHAKNIKQRIDELIENLGVNFPVYFMFTKCDLIQGFVEYFGDFSEIERAQIWGATLTASEQAHPKPREIFEEQFRRLEERAFEIRTQKLSSPLKREERKKVFLFPYQFSSLKEKLAYLIGEIFQPNPYQDNPVFRGFYFTSGTQEGVPLDLAIRNIARQYNLEMTGEKEEQEVYKEKKHYFIRDFLHDIVIGDQNYKVGHTIGYTKKSSTMKLASIGISLAVLAVYSFLSYTAMNNNTEFLEKTKLTAEAFRDNNWSGDLLTSFTKTDELGTLIQNIEDGKEKASSGIFSKHTYSELNDPLKKLYFSRTEKFFTNNIFNGLVKNLDSYANGQEFPGEKVYNYLKSYLLLGSERARYDTTEKKFLVQVFSDIFQSNYLNINTFIPANEKDSLKNMFRRHIEFFAAQLKEKDVYPVQSDLLLMSLVRNRIQYKPNAASVYSRLKQYGMSLYPNEITLDQMIGGKFSSVMKGTFNVPFIMTLEGWSTFMKDAIKEETQNPNKEDWVLGKQQFAAASAVSTEVMSRELLNFYISDYKQTWFQFLQNIRYENFTNVPMAASNLKVLSDPGNSPLTILLQEVANELKIVEAVQPSDSVNRDRFYASIKIDNIIISEINRYVNAINVSEGGGANLKSVVQQYDVISGVLESIKDGQDLITDYAEKVINQQSADFPAALQTLKGATYNLPALQNLFMSPVNLTWQVILSDAAQYLNSQWKIKVADVYNKNIAGYYPFNSGAQDLPLQDFKDFFKPGGVYWGFFDSELSKFINKERLSVNRWEKEGMKFSDEFMSSLKKANDITNTLFKNGSLNISYKLKPQLPESKQVQNQKPIIEQVYLYIDGDEEPYKMGSQFWKDYTWPGIKGTPGGRMNITVRGYGTSETKSYEGEWALFRLLDEASVTSGGSSSQYVMNWFFKRAGVYDVIVTYQLNAGSSKNPFADNFFKSFNLPGKMN
jgi:type VI secretion system protein ImpL